MLVPVWSLWPISKVCVKNAEFRVNANSEYIKVLWSNVPFISVQTILTSFSEAIVIVLQSTLNEIQKTLVDVHGVKMKLHFEGIPDNDLGTADSLKLLKGKVKVRNFI